VVVTPWGELTLALPDGGARTRILDAAFELFSRQGVTATTMGQLASEAGMSRVWLYRYFDNRDAVIRALLNREAFRFLEGLVEAAPRPVDDPAGTLAGAVLYSIHFIRHHGLLQRLMESEPSTVLPFLTTGAGPLMTRAVEVASAEISSWTGLPRERAAWVAETLVRFVSSVTLTRRAGVNFDDPAGSGPLVGALVGGLLSAAGV
jgi:AcrR family transcriptional regulator